MRIHFYVYGIMQLEMQAYSVPFRAEKVKFNAGNCKIALFLEKTSCTEPFTGILWTNRFPEGRFRKGLQLRRSKRPGLAWPRKPRYP